MRLFSTSMTTIALILGTIGLANAQSAYSSSEHGSAPASGEHMQIPPHGGPAHGDFMVEKLFERFDPQHTGVITLEAFLEDTDARFDKLDTKKQGFIDKDELQAFFGSSRQQTVDDMLKRLDPQNTGKISKADFEKPERKRFALLDLNDDGKITWEEAKLATEAMGSRGHGEHRGEGPHGGEAHGDGHDGPHGESGTVQPPSPSKL